EDRRERARQRKHGAHEEDRERDRQRREDAPERMPEEVPHDQPAVGHRCGPPPFSSTPLLRRMTSSTYPSARGSWVTMTIVFSKTRLSSRSSVRISTALFASRSPVGSSATIRS